MDTPPAEHAEALIVRLDLRGATLMVQDWGGPIGFAVATRHPDRFCAFVIGHTWAWSKFDLGTQAFSRLLGGPNMPRESRCDSALLVVK
jgi:haloalkane dehalogenase